MISEHFKSTDYDEYLIERLKDENAKISNIHTRVSIYIAIVSLLFVNSQSLLFSSLLLNSWTSYIFVALKFLFVFGLIAVILLTFLTIWYRTLGYPPSLAELNNVFQEKKDYYKENKIKKTDEQIVETIQEELRESYISVIENNFSVNLKRSKYSNFTILALFITTFVFIMMIFSFNFIPSNDIKEKVHRVKLEGEVMTTENKKETQAAAANTQAKTQGNTQTKKPEPKVKPQFYKESEDKKK